MLAQFTAATMRMEKNQENKALKQAETLAFDEVEQALLGAAPAKKDPHENGIGSYERFMGMVSQFDKRGKQM